MKVFVFGIRGFPFIGGGAERHSEELYPRLVKMGYDITILARKVYSPDWRDIKFKKIPYIDNPYLETMSHSIFCSLYCLWKRPDIVHIHNMGACLLIPLLLLRGIKVVFTLHSFNYQHKKWNRFARFVLNTCESIGINMSHKIIAISPEMRNFLRKKYNRHMPLACISNAVSKPEYVPPGLILKKFGLKEKKYVLAVGRLASEKGFDILIKAYKLISNPSFKLAIAGTGNTSYAQELKKSKSENIVFTGYQNGKDLAELYSNAGLCVLSSFHEGFPLVFLEALSYGIPMLASHITAYTHIKLPNYRYYHADNAEELALKIQNLLNVNFTADEKNSYKHILENEYDWEKVTEKTKDIYDSLS